MSPIPKPLFFFFFFNYTCLSSSLSLHLPLTSQPLSSSSQYEASLLSSPSNFRSKFKYSMALMISLPIGTPPQSQAMVLDTGSQLSWVQCHRKKLSFNPSLSSTFSVLPCSHPLCKPRIPDFTLPTSCDSNRLCHYSYFYADGTLAEGNLVKEKVTFSATESTPPLILGCATESSDDRGILGLNRGHLSFVSQSKLSKFSYCIPPSGSGSFYMGENPNSHAFRYVSLLTFPDAQRMPNLDPLAYTLPMIGIRIGGQKLNISRSVFRPDAGGSGQTMVDSGSQFTHLVDAAYDQVRLEIVRLVGPKLKKGYVYGQTADMCFGGDPTEIQRSIGSLVFEFTRGVQILVPRERLLTNVGAGLHCLGIGRSSMLGAASNIIGNVHQQNLWVEFDVANRRVGFAKADCTRLPS